jgi:hypothetical protein
MFMNPRAIGHHCEFTMHFGDDKNTWRLLTGNTAVQRSKSHSTGPKFDRYRDLA